VARSTRTASIVVRGAPEQWLPKCREALEIRGFKKIKVDGDACRITADYKQIIGTIWGNIEVALHPEQDADTRIEVAATAKTDNVYAFNKHPGAKMIEKFEDGLSSLGGIARAAPSSPTPPDPLDRLKKLTELRDAGAVTDEEFAAQKAKILADS
jgi:Short C-terminal domain